MVTNDVPKSVGIRTDDWNEYRFDVIEQAATFDDCNRNDAVADDDVPALDKAARDVLDRDDLTTAQKREIAETLSTRGVSFNAETTINMDRGD